MNFEQTIKGFTSHHIGDADYQHQGEGSAKTLLMIAVCITLGFAFVEVIGGLLSNSLALLSDAGHMVTDSFSLFLAMLAAIVAKKAANSRYSFGFAKIEVLAAMLNAILMFVVVGWIIFEAVERFEHPMQVQGGSVFIVATLGLLINVLMAYLLSKDDKNINTKSALIHVMGDLLGSVAAIVAGVVIYFGGPMQIDPLLSVFVGILILRSASEILWKSVKLLLDAVPDGVNYEEVGIAIGKVPNVCSVHDLHIWDMSADKTALSAHIYVDDLAKWPKVLAKTRKLLKDKYNIDHITLQPELM